MDSKHTNPGATVPQRKPSEPLSDRGEGDKTWSPEQGKQGISNRPDDQDQNQEAEEPTEPSKDEGERLMANRTNHVERGGEVHADTPDKWSEDDKARQEQGLPKSPSINQHDGKGHGELKGTDAPATTDAERSGREKGKRTTM